MISSGFLLLPACLMIAVIDWEGWNCGSEEQDPACSTAALQSAGETTGRGTHQLHRAAATDLQMWKESEHWVSANDSLVKHDSEAQDPRLVFWQKSLRSTSAGHVPRVWSRPRREQPEAWHVADSGRYHRTIKLHSLRWLPGIWCDCVEIWWAVIERVKFTANK